MAAEVPKQKSWGLARRLTRLLRRKGSSAGSSVAYSVASDVYDESLDSSINSLSKLKLSGNMAAAYSLDAFFKTAAGKNGPPRQPPVPVPAADAHAFVASLFAGVSAVKASYAQLQLAQHPYDADAIQQGDAALVAELGKLSDQKRRYVRDPAGAVRDAAAGPAAAALADEQRHLIRTYEITARKLDAELRARDAAADRARRELAEELRAARALEERVRPGSLAALDGLHLSGLSAAHFGTALRHAVKSVRSFARSMLDEMRLAGWDTAAAAAAVHPGVPLRRAGDAVFALESYVALKMFAGFHRRDFGLSCLERRGSYDRRRFFEEFAELQSAPAAARRGALGGFLRDRYSSVVHERMEAASFGRQRGAALTESAWFGEFAEMARRVWLLHCLFFAFDGGASIFQARPGERFSEVYMESVSDVDGEDGGWTAPAPAGNRGVGFTVVPGFRVGRSVMQCRVYLSRPARRT
ncbi:hypothetical protein QYE76_010403 [Lolium multiflorum]|uniref:DUF641 domain-containing protein n=1 Tax=Lolium multiflorum TaxID=4521 RepID=A0AAD8X239_LOLMU|nr:hypothetical protein QYE76_010403 [Lolium multiflorum]